jgi:NDP-sugar pyrophosphorylase family protein
MVLGAGLGSRLRPFVDALPKPLMPVLGVPCIEFSLLSLCDAGVKNVTVNVHKHAEMMRSYLETHSVPEIKVSISDESANLLGSAGGFRKALPNFHDQAFFALNADVITTVDLSALRTRHLELKKKHQVAMTLTIARGKTVAASQGEYTQIILNQESGLIEGLGVKKAHTPFYMGVAIFEPECFSHLKLNEPSEFVPEVLLPLLKKNRVGFYESEDLWMDVGSPELWFQTHFDLQKAYEKGELPESWLIAIQKNHGRFGMSEANSVVDYDDANPLGKNYIRLDTIQYAIARVGTST